MALPLRDVTNLLPKLNSGAVVLSSTNQQVCLPETNVVVAKSKRNVMATGSNDSGCGLMDDSLTDMQWLQRMDASQELHPIGPGGSRKQGGGAANKENRSSSKTSSKDGCRKKLDYTLRKTDSNKPPLSYASLIALAICSTPQRMMTLSGIYRWIESTFPFYRTPEAKAWKNSIRHNLSIRKNMFMKVYQYPPRRGNGSYWTLLSDGEEELKRAVPLFTTLRPPVIDSESVYNRQASTQTIKTKGQFVPLLPRSTSTSSNLSQPYFAVECGTSALASGVPGLQSDEVYPTTEVIVDSVPTTTNDNSAAKYDDSSEETPQHLADHNYAQVPLSSSRKASDNVAHVATEMVLEESVVSEERFSSTPKRRKCSVTSRFPSKPPKQQKVATNDLQHTTNVVVMESGQQQNNSDKPTFSNSFFSLNTPSRDQNESLHLLDSSLLTPLTKLAPEMELGPISLSPLYANFVTPNRSQPSPSIAQPTNTVSTTSTQPPTLSSLFTPLKSADSGVFSPFQSADSLMFRYSTPMRSALSPLTDLFPSNTLNAPQTVNMFSPFKGLDASSGVGTTPIRLGSLQALGLPGLTPPPPPHAKK